MAKIKNYANAEVYKLLDRTGKRVGISIHPKNGTVQTLNNKNTILLGNYLRQNNIQLSNAKIGTDGRMYLVI